jgi:hypothetical protein
MMPLGWPTRRRSGDVVILAYHRVGNVRSEIELPADLRLDLAREIAFLPRRYRLFPARQQS